MKILLLFLLIFIISVIVILIVKCFKNYSNFNSNHFNSNNLILNPIPKVIHKVIIQNSGNLPKFPLEPKELQDAHDSWKKMNPEYEIKYYSMNDCREYLKKNYEDSDFLQTFDCLNAYAFKCDFFRYCVLYNEGGWYSDWKQVCLKQNLLNELDFNKKYNIIFCLDKGTKTAHLRGYIQNCFIGSIKQNLFLKECINQIINNVKYNFYGSGALDATSPYFLGRMYKKSKYVNFNFNLEFYNQKIYYKNKSIINHKCDECGINQDWKNGNNYNLVWNKKKMYKNFKIKNRIPKIIHKTGPDSYNNLSNELLTLFNKTKLKNPGYKIIYYNDNDCFNLIKNNFKSDVLWAYEKLKPTAYKADLFRYCILYLYGGIYSDLTQDFLIKLDNIIDFDKDTLILGEDYNEGIQISFICTIPKNNIFIKCIDKIIENCKNEYYGHFLEITGPRLFKKILDNINVNYIIKFYQSNKFLIDDNKKKIIKCKSSNHDKIIYTNSTHYYKLWNNRDIYN